MENKFSDVPQIIKLKCLKNQYETITFALAKNKKIKLLNDEINTCNINQIVYSLNDIDFSNSIRDSYKIETNQDLKINNDQRKKVVFSKGEHIIKENLTLNNKNIIFEGGSKICCKKIKFCILKILIYPFLIKKKKLFFWKLF